MDEQVLQRLAHEFAGHDDVEALLSAVRSAAADEQLLERFEHELTAASDTLDTLQIPQYEHNGPRWKLLTLAERITILHQRMLYHLRQAQTTTAAPQPMQAIMELVTDTTLSASVELAEVHSLLNAYGVSAFAGYIEQPDGSREHVPARAGVRLRWLHRLMVEDGLPDFMPPGMVNDPPDAYAKRLLPLDR